MPTAELSEVEAHLQSRLNGRVRHLRLELCDGLVLAGYARTYYAKQLARHAVMEVSDVPIRANDIEVE
jgi:hypothetical protein